MNDLSEKNSQKLEEAAADTAWAEKLRASATWDELEKVLAEKDIEAPSKFKEAFDAHCANKSGKLDDDELKNVSGGWTFFPCNQKYDFFLCQFVSCPNLKRTEYYPDDTHYTYHCNLFNWDEIFSYCM